MKAGIIGGTGRMGRLFAGDFERAGADVEVSGRNTSCTAAQIARDSDIIVISVPIHNTAEVIREVAPLLAPTQLICDLTSLKVFPMKEMLLSQAEVIGLHPMFGPSVQSLQQQTVIVTPGRCRKETLAMLTGILESEGARITLATPEEHDRMMAVVQGLTHFVSLSMAGTMRKIGVTPRETEPFTSPVYQIETGIVGRLLSQDPVLYGDILRMNPYVEEVIGACCAAAEETRDAVLSKDPQTFERLFTMDSRHLGDYCRTAACLTDFLIESMVKR